MSNESILVIDNGSYSCKIGFAGENKPRTVIECILGEENKHNVTGISNKNNFGAAVFDGAMLNVIKPIRHGVIDDFQALEKLYSHVFEQLKIKIDEFSVRITDPPLNSNENKEKICELFMENYQTRELCIQNQGPLVLNTTNQNTGVVVDIGHDIGHIIPIYEGYALQKSISKFEIAGDDLTNYLIQLFGKRGFMFTSMKDNKDAQEIKEKFCEVRMKNENQTSSSHSLAYRKFISRNQKLYAIGDEKYDCCEILFQPQIIGRKDGLHKLIFHSILKCDNEIQKTMFNNIVLAGGTMNLEKIDERIKQELLDLSDNKIQIKVVKQPDPQLLSWIGASKMALSSSMKQISINQTDYQDIGKKIAHERFF